VQIASHDSHHAQLLKEEHDTKVGKRKEKGYWWNGKLLCFCTVNEFFMTAISDDKETKMVFNSQQPVHRNSLFIKSKIK
jgi:hypothetical protein